MAIEGKTAESIVMTAVKSIHYMKPSEIVEVLSYSARKCEAVGKDADYLPLLFENEIEDYLARKEINEGRRLNYVS